MASKTDKLIKIAEDTRQRILSGEQPEFSPKYKVNVIPYSWDYHKKISKIKDVNEVGKLYDFMISEKIGIEQVPRTIRSKGHILPNREKPPFMYLNLSRFSDFLDSVGTEKSREISRVFKRADVRNSTDEYEIQTVKDCMDSVLTSVENGIFSKMSPIDLKNLSVYMEIIQESLSKAMNPEPMPESEDLSAQKPSIEPSKDLEFSKTCSDMSEIAKDLEKYEPKKMTIESYCKKWVNDHEPDGNNPKFDVYETPHGVIFVDHGDGSIIPKFDKFKEI